MATAFMQAGSCPFRARRAPVPPIAMLAAPVRPRQQPARGTTIAPLGARSPGAGLRRVVGPGDHFFACDQARATSSMRFEKPHSLSYHDTAFTRLPSVTSVWVASNTEECGSWLKSTETSGSSL